ncbi:MAG: lysylphosphatidylglycerol synthase domain-containing protein [Gemmatimonadota bacterium]
MRVCGANAWAAQAPGASDLKRWLLLAAQLAATILVTWFVVDRAGVSLDGLRDFDVAGWTLRPGLLLLSCALLAAGYLVTGALWGRITRDLGGGATPWFAAARLFMIANLGRYIPGKVWQIAGLAALATQRGIPGPKAAAAAIVGQGVAIVAASTIGAGRLWTYADGAGWRWLVPVVLVALILIGLVPAVFSATSRLWFRVARSEVPAELDSRHGAEWLGIGLASWLVYAGAFWLLVRGLGYDVALLDTASSFAAAYVLGYLFIPAPAGLGIREGALVFFLAGSLGPNGAVAASAVAALARLWTTAVEVVLAAAFWAKHVADGQREAAG